MARPRIHPTDDSTARNAAARARLRAAGGRQVTLALDADTADRLDGLRAREEDGRGVSVAEMLRRLVRRATAG